MVNVFVLGRVGTGRSTMVKRLVWEKAVAEPLMGSEDQQLGAIDRAEVDESERDLQQQVAGMLRKARVSQKEAQGTLADLDRQVASFAAGHFVDELQAKR